MTSQTIFEGLCWRRYQELLSYIGPLLEAFGGGLGMLDLSITLANKSLGEGIFIKE